MGLINLYCDYEMNRYFEPIIFNELVKLIQLDCEPVQLIH